MSARFNTIEAPLAGLKILQRKLIGDNRGYLERLFCDTELSDLLGCKTIRQINHTLTEKKGALRGMHFQHPPYAETKFVSCLKGEVYDVAVDLRAGSPTFLQWYAEVLGEENLKTMVIPEGFAHGFQTMSDNCEMLYFHTESYNPEAEAGLNAMDPLLAIQWPLPVSDLSSRDRLHPMMDNTFSGVAL